MPASTFFAIIFFLMLLTLGLDSTVSRQYGRQWPSPIFGVRPQKHQKKQNYRYHTITKGFKAGLASPCAFCKTATGVPILAYIGLNKIKLFVSVILWQLVTDLETQPNHLIHQLLVECSLPGSCSLVLVNLQNYYRILFFFHTNCI